MMADEQALASVAAAETAAATSNVELVDELSPSSCSVSNDEKVRKFLKPAPTLDDVRDILIDYYSDGDDPTSRVHIVKQLDSYDDCNYQVVVDDKTYLLKITNGLESLDYINSLTPSSSSSQSIIEFQNSIMNALHENHIGTTIPVKPVRYDRQTRKSSINHALADSTTMPFLTNSKYSNGYVILHSLPVVSKSHSPTLLAIRLYIWLSGQPMATIPYHRLSLHTMVNVGQQLGRINHILDDVLTPSSPARPADLDELTHLRQPMPSFPQHRYHQWDTKNTYDLLPFTQYIPDAKRRAMIESIIHTFHADILTKAGINEVDDDPNPTTASTTVATMFRRGIIMGDYNDANILLHGDTLQFTGVIDFGDSVER